MLLINVSVVCLHSQDRKFDVFPFRHGDQQECPFTGVFVTLDLLDMVIVPLLFRYYKHNIGPVFVLFAYYISPFTCTQY